MILFVLAFIFDSPEEIFNGYINILQSPSVLISDYLCIGGLGATLFNVATIMLLNLALVKKLGFRMTGPIFADIFTIAGFSFFGKNIFNTLPIYLGIYLFARIQKLPFRSFIIVVLFSTGISPLVSFMISGTGWPLYLGIPIGIISGMLAGFVLPSFSAHTIRFHRGYNLYNIGFAMGVLSMVFAVILHSFNVELNVGGPTSESYHTQSVWIVILLSTIYLAAAFILDPKVIKKYPKLMKSSGRFVSDFVKDFGRPVTMLNIAVMGYISVFVLLILNLQINGTVMGGILTIMSFAAFGKHPLNAIQVMFGAWLGVLLTNYTFDSVGMVLALLFVTAVAPISGRYGPFIGIIAGFLHILITPIAYAFQGGFDLYNNDLPQALLLH
ncbi:MAG: DUF1576 domain-containing protein [Acholeplasma sp.]